MRPLVLAWVVAAGLWYPAVDDATSRAVRSLAGRYRRWADQRCFDAQQTRRRDVARALHPSGKGGAS